MIIQCGLITEPTVPASTTEMSGMPKGKVGLGHKGRE